MNGKAHALQPTSGSPTRATTYTPAVGSVTSVPNGTGLLGERLAFLNSSATVTFGVHSVSDSSLPHKVLL
jgi:hypothetical protein